MVAWTLRSETINALKLNQKNPRRLTKEQAEQLTTSISKYGLCEPIVANLDGTVIGGHQRLRTLKKLGHKTVDVYYPSKALNEREADELNIRLNKNTGEWDFDSLANNWDASDLINWGFTQDELQLEEVPTEESEDFDKEDSPARLTITFASAAHLQKAENRISTIVDEFKGATYKVKI